MRLPSLPCLLLPLACMATAHAAPVVFTDQDAFVNASQTQLEDFESPPWLPDTNFTGTVVAAGTVWSSASQLRTSTFTQRSGAASLSVVDAATADPLDRIEARFAGALDAVGLALRSAGRTDLVVELLDMHAAVLAGHRQLVSSEWVFVGWAHQGLGAHSLQIRALRDGGGFTDDFFIDDVRWGAAGPGGCSGSRARRAVARSRGTGSADRTCPAAALAARPAPSSLIRRLPLPSSTESIPEPLS